MKYYCRGHHYGRYEAYYDNGQWKDEFHRPVSSARVFAEAESSFDNFSDIELLMDMCWHYVGGT